MMKSKLVPIVLVSFVAGMIAAPLLWNLDAPLPISSAVAAQVDLLVVAGDLLLGEETVRLLLVHVVGLIAAGLALPGRPTRKLPEVTADLALDHFASLARFARRAQCS